MIVRAIDGWDPPNLCAGSGPDEYADSTWHHATFVSNFGYHSLYIDGELKDTYSGSSLTDQRMIYFGLTAPNQIVLDYWYDGFLDEVRVYNRALNDEEILELYNNPDGLEPMILKGTISNLDATAGSLITFTAKKLRITTFSPFEIRYFTSGETIIIKNQYLGILNPHFAIGIFKGEI